MSEEKEIKLPIDTSLGKLPQKPKGSIVPVECKTMEEIRRHQLERLAAGFRMFSHFGYDEGIAGGWNKLGAEFRRQRSLDRV